MFMIKKDKIVMNLIYNSITQNYLRYLIGKEKDCTIAYWNALEKVFSNTSHAQLFQLRWYL